MSLFFGFNFSNNKYGEKSVRLPLKQCFRTRNKVFRPHYTPYSKSKFKRFYENKKVFDKKISLFVVHHFRNPKEIDTKHNTFALFIIYYSDGTKKTSPQLQARFSYIFIKSYSEIALKSKSKFWRVR